MRPHDVERPGSSLVQSDGMEIILRTAHRHEEIDEIIKEKGGQHDESRTAERSRVFEERHNDREGNHGVIGEIAQVEGFAVP